MLSELRIVYQTKATRLHGIHDYLISRQFLSRIADAEGVNLSCLRARSVATGHVLYNAAL